MESTASEAERAEKLEAELDRIIERRAREARDEGRIEELWKDSVRREAMKRREINRRLWIRHFEALTSVLRRRAEEFEEEARTLLEDGTTPGEGGR